MVAGLVRSGAGSVAFTGTVRTYDLLDDETWGRSIAQSPVLALAALRFTRKNARFFAGLRGGRASRPARMDPAGRVFAELRLERTACSRTAGSPSAWGDWGDRVRGRRSVPGRAGRRRPAASLPDEIRRGLGAAGRARSRSRTGEGLVVLPVRLDRRRRGDLRGGAVGGRSRSPGPRAPRRRSGRPAVLVAGAGDGGGHDPGRGEVGVGRAAASGAGSFERIARSRASNRPTRRWCGSVPRPRLVAGMVVRDGGR